MRARKESARLRTIRSRRTNRSMRVAPGAVLANEGRLFFEGLVPALLEDAGAKRERAPTNDPFAANESFHARSARRRPRERRKTLLRRTCPGPSRRCGREKRARAYERSVRGERIVPCA